MLEFQHWGRIPLILPELTHVNGKSGWFTSKCKGDRVIAIKWQKITLVLDSILNAKHALAMQRSHVASWHGYVSLNDLLLLLKWPFIPHYSRICTEL